MEKRIQQIMQRTLWMENSGMSPQIDIFELHRKADPSTSREAAEKVRQKAESECVLIWRALRAAGRCNMKTLSEVSGINYFLLQKRISVLERKGKAERRQIGENDRGNPVYESLDGGALWRAI